MRHWRTTLLSVCIVFSLSQFLSNVEVTGYSSRLSQWIHLEKWTDSLTGTTQQSSSIRNYWHPAANQDPVFTKTMVEAVVISQLRNVKQWYHHNNTIFNKLWLHYPAVYSLLICSLVFTTYSDLNVHSLYNVRAAHTVSVSLWISDCSYTVFVAFVIA